MRWLQSHGASSRRRSTLHRFVAERHGRKDDHLRPTAARDLAAPPRELLAGTRSRAVLVTRGSRGMALFERDKATEHIPIYGSDEIADVTGAGDTVIATLTLAVAAARLPVA